MTDRDGFIDSIRENVSRRSGFLPGLALVGVLALAAAGCAGTSMQEGSSGSQVAAADAERGAAIWRTTCYRCHNRRPATEFSEEEWAVLVDHMRTRAHLSGSEADAVTAFLQELAASR